MKAIQLSWALILAAGGLYSAPTCAAQARVGEASQAAPGIKSLDAVVVTALVETTVGSYQDLLMGVAKFNELKPSLSPSAVLRYRVPKDIAEIYVQHPSKGFVRIPVDSNGEFAVPFPGLEVELGKEQKWPLLVRSLKVSEILPAIHSPSSTETARMVGDLRLYCETLWATQKGNASRIQKMALGLTGGMCGSRRVAFIFPVERKLAGAGIEGAAKTVPAKISHDRMGFSIPLFDRKLSNDARIQLQFEP